KVRSPGNGYEVGCWLRRCIADSQFHGQVQRVGLYISEFSGEAALLPFLSTLALPPPELPRVHIATPEYRPLQRPHRASCVPTAKLENLRRSVPRSPMLPPKIGQRVPFRIEISMYGRQNQGNVLFRKRI